MKHEIISFDAFTELFDKLELAQETSTNILYENFNVTNGIFLLTFLNKTPHIAFEAGYDYREIPSKHICISKDTVEINGKLNNLNFFKFANIELVDRDFLIGFFYLLLLKFHSGETVINSLHLLSSLFEISNEDFREIIGLAGELVFILSSNSPALMVSNWHKGLEDVFDFSESGRYFEVKTTTSSRRVHSVSSNQLVSEHKPVFVSVKLFQVENGDTIHNIVEKISSKLDSDMNQIFLKKLANYPTLKQKYTTTLVFDLASAINSIKYYSIPENIVPDLDNLIVSYVLKINFEGIEAEKIAV